MFDEESLQRKWVCDRSVITIHAPNVTLYALNTYCNHSSGRNFVQVCIVLPIFSKWTAGFLYKDGAHLFRNMDETK